MKFRSIILFAIFVSAAVAAAGQTKAPVKKAPEPKLPTVHEVIEKYVKAIGGREANEKIKSRVLTGTVEFNPMGIAGTFENYTAADAKSMTKMDLAGLGALVEGSDGVTAWSVNPIQGSREKTGVELAQTKLNNNFYRDINLEKLYGKLELKGIEKVGGKDAYVVVGTPAGLPASTWYFDTATGLLLRSDSTISTPEGDQASKSFFDEWRTVDGVAIPVKVRLQVPTAEITMTVTEIKNNVPIEPAKFAKPKE